MPNHFHLFVNQTTPDKSLSQFISGLGNSFTKGMNTKYNRSGVLFSGKTKSKQLEDESYFKWVVKYILENPVKAKIVQVYDDYNYSSANELLGLKEETVTNVNTLLGYFDSFESFKNFMADEKLQSDYEI